MASVLLLPPEDGPAYLDFSTVNWQFYNDHFIITVNLKLELDPKLLATFCYERFFLHMTQIYRYENSCSV